MSKAKRYYIVEGVFEWSQINFGQAYLGKDAAGSFGFSPVFTNKRKLEKFCRESGCKYRTVTASERTKKGGAT